MRSDLGGLVRFHNVISIYITLYINPLYQHASGIVGGRFSEFPGGLPSFELVTREIPEPAWGGECANVERTTITDSLTLMDYYAARDSYTYDSDRPETTTFECNIPDDEISAWFGSADVGDATEVFGRVEIPIDITL